MGKKSWLSELTGKASLKKRLATLKRSIPDRQAEWFDHIFSTAPVDHGQAEHAIDKTYQLAGFPPPTTKIWHLSPLAGAREAIKLQSTHNTIHNKIDLTTINYLNYNISLAFKTHIRDDLSANIRQPLKTTLLPYYTNHFFSAIKHNLILADQMEHPPKGFGLPQDAHWLAYYSLYQDLLPLKLKRLEGLLELAKSCGWCWFFEGTAILTERPVQFSRQRWSLETGFLALKDKEALTNVGITDFQHAENNHYLMSIEYADGSEVTTWKNYWKRLPIEFDYILSSLVQKWRDIYNDLHQSDKKQAEQAIDQVYHSLNLPPPTDKKWFRSPLEAARFIIKKTRNTNTVTSQKRDIIPVQLRNKIQQLIDEKTNRRLLDEAFLQQRQSYWHIIQQSISQTVSKKPRQKIFQLVPDSLDIGEQDILSRLIPETRPLLEAPITLAKNCSFWWGLADIALLVEKPITQHFDPQDRLHCEDAPALSYSDGFNIYAWHGNLIEAQLIENRHNLTPALVLEEENAELRRIKMEIFLETHSADNIVEAFKATVLDDIPCLGLKRQLVLIGEERYLYCTNGSLEPDGTRRSFLLGVPSEEIYDWENDIDILPPQTAHEASAWTYGINPKHYAEQVRT